MRASSSNGAADTDAPAARWLSSAQLREEQPSAKDADARKRTENEWLGPEEREENPLATAAWLPAADAAPKGRDQPAPPVVEPTSLPDDAATYGRRTRAVEAYCHELDPAGPAATSAEQILNSLSGGISDDNLLLKATRTAAAKQLADGRHESTSRDCAVTLARLAERANGTLADSQVSQLEEHLDSCLVCRAAELRCVRADRAFAAILGLKLTTNTPATRR